MHKRKKFSQCHLLILSPFLVNRDDNKSGQARIVHTATQPAKQNTHYPPICPLGTRLKNTHDFFLKPAGTGVYQYTCEYLKNIYFINFLNKI